MNFTCNIEFDEKDKERLISMFSECKNIMDERNRVMKRFNEIHEMIGYMPPINKVRK